ncbi:uncharacterized protein [Branchiostoma lanceolatum]|uniref:uncharacterized protein n=1 Tax=Branchiostoma lanceolatum TaxID=7740 RepID=UPI0034572987
MEALERELSCPYCHNLFSSPLLLPCGHSVCCKCAYNLLASSGISKVTVNPESSEETDRCFSCPECKNAVFLDDRGLGCLCPNLTLQNIIERVKGVEAATARSDGNLACEVCEKSPAADAVKTCVTCELSFCDKCLTAVHSRKAFVKHRLVDPLTRTMPKTPKCQDHAEDKLSLYCVSDETIICPRCTEPDGRHSAHPVVELPEMYQEMKDILRTSVENLAWRITDYEKGIQLLQAMYQLVCENASRHKSSLFVELDSLISTLQKKKQVLGDTIDHERNEKLSVLKTHIERYQEKMDHGIGVVALGGMVLKEKDPACFLQTAAAVNGRILDVASPEPLQAGITEHFRPVNVDLGEVGEVLDTLDFMEGEMPEDEAVGLEWDNSAVQSPEEPAESETADYENPAPPEPDHTFKIVIVGDSGVGKSNLLSRFAFNRYDSGSKPTIGIEFATKTMKIEGKTIKAQIWDTAGDDRYRPIISACCRGAVGAFLVYDITRHGTFEHAQNRLKELQEDADDQGIMVMLVGNKCDLSHIRTVPIREARDFAKQRSLHFFETSAADIKNVDDAFERLMTEVYYSVTGTKPEGDSGSSEEEFY